MQGVGIREEGVENPFPALLSLALLVLGVFADDANDATAVDDLAFVANLLY
jgi:hypothetical protein